MITCYLRGIQRCSNCIIDVGGNLVLAHNYQLTREKDMYKKILASLNKTELELLRYQKQSKAFPAD